MTLKQIYSPNKSIGYFHFLLFSTPLLLEEKKGLENFLATEKVKKKDAGAKLNLGKFCPCK